MIMNIKFIFASDQNNVVIKKKSNDNDAFKFKQFAHLKRITFDVENRIRIDKSAVRSRFISKHFRNVFKVRRRIFSSFEHFETQIEKQNDEFFDEFMNDNDDNNDDNDDATLFSVRRSHTKFIVLNFQKTYQIELRRRMNIKRLKKKLKFILFAQRTLLSFFSHIFYFFVVFFVFDSSNSYSNSSNFWLSFALSKHVIEIRTIFLHNVDSKYFKVEKKFISVSLRLLKDVYHCALNFRNFSKFIFFWAIFNVFSDSRAKFFRNIIALLRVLKMYCNVMFDFVHSNVRHELSWIMNQYRFRIMRMHIHKIWLSILTWHEKSLVRIVRIDQNNSFVWRIKHDITKYIFKNIIVIVSNKKTIDFQSFFISKTKNKKFDKSNDRVTTFNENCWTFNHNIACEFSSCIYKHICFKCQLNDHDQYQCFQNKVAKWLIDAFSLDSSFLSFSFFFFFYSSKMIMSISIEWSFEKLLYDVVFDDALKFEIKMSLKIENWRLYLLKHFDQHFVSKLLDIIKRNASVEYIEIKKFHISENHRSINEILDILTANFNKQFIARRMNRMFFSFLEYHICSLLSLILKHDDEWRRIHDLSYFRNNSINEVIIENVEVLKYVTFDEIIAIFIFQERDAVMLKKNLANAFKHISVILLNRWLLDFQWMKIHYIELYLLFDLRIVFFLFDLFAKTLHWILVINDFRIILHYLDDFLIILKFLIDSKSFKKIWRQICENLDFEINEKKKKFDTKFEFLDIELDDEVMKIKLFSVKLTKTMKVVDAILIANTFTYRQIDFFVSFLFFCSKVVVSRRFFLISLYVIRNRIKNAHKSCRIIEAMRLDLRWWQTFLSQWNDVKILRTIFFRLSNHIWTNVSNNWDIKDFWFRAFNDESFEFFSLRYIIRYRNRTFDIQIKKMRKMLKVLRQWLFHFENNKIIIHCDNQIVCFEFIKDIIHDSTMTSFRNVIMLFAFHDIIVEMKWLNSKSNHLINLLSRDEHDKIVDEYSQLQIRHEQLSN